MSEAGARVRALIADDEPLLAAALAGELRAAWPALEILASAGNGVQAIERTFAERPDVLFLDIRMPGASGIEVAQAIAEDWREPAPGGAAPPLVVFVTAYGEFALEAFDQAAVDYVLKPVTAERLERTVARLQARLAARTSASPLDALGVQLRALLSSALEDARGQSRPGAAGGARGDAARAGAERLRTVRAGVGDTVRLVPVDEVLLFEAADKYVLVCTATQELLIRESLRELLPRLEPARFAQIHRGTIVNLERVEAAVREDGGRVTLRLKGSERRPVVSRLYTHLFRAM